MVLEMLSFASIWASISTPDSEETIEQEKKGIYVMNTMFYTVDSFFDIISGIVRLVLTIVGLSEFGTRIINYGADYATNYWFWIDLTFMLVFIACSVPYMYRVVYGLLNFITVNMYYFNQDNAQIHIWTMEEWIEYEEYV